MKTLTIIPETGEFDCLIERVVDGDTFDVLFFHRQRIRLRGVQAAEKSTVKGKMVIEKLTDLLAMRPGTATLHGTEKFGRMLASIKMEDGNDLAEWLVASGLAVKWDGRGPRPVGQRRPEETE